MPITVPGRLVVGDVSARSRIDSRQREQFTGPLVAEWPRMYSAAVADPANPYRLSLAGFAGYRSANIAR